MATIVATFDTKTKAISVSMDGAAVENVWGVHFGKSYDDEEKYNCEIMTASKDKENGTMSYTRLMASEQDIPVGSKYLSEAPEFQVDNSNQPFLFTYIGNVNRDLASYYNEKV